MASREEQEAQAVELFMKIGLVDSVAKVIMQ